MAVPFVWLNRCRRHCHERLCDDGTPARGVGGSSATCHKGKHVRARRLRDTPGDSTSLFAKMSDVTMHVNAN